MDKHLLIQELRLVCLRDTVLGPIMFLLYINDIGQNIASKLFAEDCVYIELLNPYKMNKLYKKILQ